MIKAEEATKLAANFKTELAVFEIIESWIKGSATEGKHNVTLIFNGDNNIEYFNMKCNYVKETLEKEGFTVKISNLDKDKKDPENEELEGWMLKISWPK